MRRRKLAGEDVGGKTVVDGVGALDHLVHRIEGRDRHDRAEGLLAHDACFIVDTAEDRRLIVVAGVEFRWPSPATFKPSARGRGIGDDRLDRLQAPAVGERPDVGILGQRMADLQPSGQIDEALDEGIVPAAMDEESAGRHADLAGIAELHRHGEFGNLLGIGIGADDHRCMAAKLQREPLEGVGALTVERLADGYRAGKRDLAHQGRGHNERRDLTGRPHQEIDQARRQAGVVAAFHQQHRRDGRLFRGPADDGAAGSERRRNLARQEHERKIPGGEGGDHADRFACHRGVPAGKAALDRLAVKALGFLSVPFELVGGEPDLGVGMAGRATQLLCHGLAKARGAFAHQIADPSNDLGALPGGRARPRTPSLFGGGNCRLDIAGPSRRHAAQRPLARRIDHVDLAPVRTSAPLASDVQTEAFVHRVLPNARFSPVAFGGQFCNACCVSSDDKSNVALSQSCPPPQVKVSATGRGGLAWADRSTMSN